MEGRGRGVDSFVSLKLPYLSTMCQQFCCRLLSKETMQLEGLNLDPQILEQSDMVSFGNCVFIGNLGICASQFQLRSHSFFCSPLKRKLVGNIQSS